MRKVCLGVGEGGQFYRPFGGAHWAVIASQHDPAEVKDPTIHIAKFAMVISIILHSHLCHWYGMAWYGTSSVQNHPP